MLKGNKGEWSEIYVFLKLLAEGKLYAADENLDPIATIYYPLIKIFRKEGTQEREYIYNGEIKIVEGTRGDLLFAVPTIQFVHYSQILLDLLKSTDGRSMVFPIIEEFLSLIDVKQVKINNTDKSDIQLMVHDLNTGMSPKLGFSIKSMIGKDSTLFNPGAGTNFIYKIKGATSENFDLVDFNSSTLFVPKGSKVKSKIAQRIISLENQGYEVEFDHIQSDNLTLNLQLIDGQLPELLGQMVYLKYKNGISNTRHLIEMLKEINPLQYDQSKGHPFYEVKIKNFLTESALGMTPETIWTGVYDATGGIIIVKRTGEIVCYHIYNRKEFQEYLVHNTRLEQASTSEDDTNPGNVKAGKTKPYKFGWVYKENEDYFIKLNLQVRFK
ncbi:HpaII family restriction endonuclease [Sphingobacterium bovisgrunnientis]|uniref:HpaII family restriction endonuclease n=1 Tax=Sphingobacterium bovisgrunnientis TaxID=1874697 RepID=UPI001957B721|nr:HpaII family restriction endonuclease [Sphingobacterium bovisgrunnientis]